MQPAGTVLWQHRGSKAKVEDEAGKKSFPCLSCFIRRAPQEAAHVPVSSQTPAAASLKPGHAAPRRVRESPSGNICLFLGVLDSSVYLDGPRSQSQILPSHLESPASLSQAQSQGTILSRQLSSYPVVRIYHVGSALISLLHPVPFLPALLISKCVHTYQ